MKSIIDTVRDWIAVEDPDAAFEVLVMVVVGLTVARLAGVAMGRVVGARVGPSQGLLVRRIVWYGLLFVVLTTALRSLGLDLGVLLGAAGILTVAIGFASQTSASNLISGLFLLAERPFTVGDVVTVGQTTGEVTAVDLLSVKLRTFDNLLVRIPNETLLKSEIRNLSGFPIRRIDILLTVPFDADLERVEQVLFEVADENPECLDEPRPLFQCLAYAESGIALQYSVWVARDNLIPVRTQLFVDIQRAFARHAIHIPLPQRVVHTAPPVNPPG